MRAKHGPFDVVLLFLHGAMVSSGCDDCEGDIIARLRDIVGPRAIIGAVLDLHCHLTEKMVTNADVIIPVKEYPHIDFPERSEELYELCVRAAKGEIKPTTAVFDCRMVGFYPTTTEPMRSLTDKLFAAEKRPGVLSAGFAHGFPWGDMPETGSRVLVVTDNDPELARETAEELGTAIYRAREALLPRFADIETALGIASQSNGIAVLADTADNSGGGAPSDNVSLLKAMLARGMQDAAFGAIWDPISAEICADAGLGATLSLQARRQMRAGVRRIHRSRRDGARHPRESRSDRSCRHARAHGPVRLGRSARHRHRDHLDPHARSSVPTPSPASASIFRKQARHRRQIELALPGRLRSDGRHDHSGRHTGRHPDEFRHHRLQEEARHELLPARARSAGSRLEAQWAGAKCRS